MSWTVYNSSGQLLQATDLPDNSVDSDQYVDGSIDTAHMAASQITNALMADDAIGVAELSATGTASSSTFLRGDNAWAAPAGGPSQAVQSAIEAETNEDTYAPPDLMKYSPTVAKVWANWNQSGSHTFRLSYNCTSVSDLGTGASALVIATDFSGDEYAAVVGSAAYTVSYGHLAQKTAGQINIRVASGDAETVEDTGDCSVALFGDQ